MQISLTAALLQNQSSRFSCVFHFFKTADFFVARRPGATGGDNTNDLLFSGIKVAKIFMTSNLKLRIEEVGFLNTLIWLFTTHTHIFVKSYTKFQTKS